MEQRTVSLVKISPTLAITDCHIAIISQKLCHLCLISSDKYANVYSISSKTENGPCLTLIWKSLWKVDSCKFSEDGQQLFAILETKSFQIYNIHDTTLDFLAEEDTILLSALLESTGIDITESTELKTVVFSKSQLTVLVENKWLVSFWIQYPMPLSVTSIIEVSSCKAVGSSSEYVYSLTAGGNVTAYSVRSGRQIGVVNLYSLLPHGQGSEVLETFSAMTVSTNGDFIAVSDITGKVFIARVQEYFSTDLQEESSRWNCGDSVISASSGTSRTSVRTISSLLRIQPSSSVGDSSSIYMFELTEKDKVHSYKMTWDTYLHSLKQNECTESVTGRNRGHKSQNIRRVNESGLLCVSEPPVGFGVQGLHMTAAGLAVWYTASGSSFGGVYRLYDVASGAFLAEQVVPTDTVVIPGGCLGLMDAFLSPSCLWLFLGNLSRDVLMNKLLHCVETESVGRLLRGGEWGDLIVPLPALADGLRQHQMDVVRLALSLHSQAFRTSFVINPGDSDVVWQTKVQNISLNMDKLFATVFDSLLENKNKLSFSEQVVLLYLNHANDLLQFLHEYFGTESALHSVALHDTFEKKKSMLVKQIMLHVVELRRYLRKHSRDNVVASGTYQPLGCLGDVLKKEWSKWQDMEDCDVICEAVASNNIPLLQTFLSTCRGWSSSNLFQRIKQEVYVWVQQLLKQDIEKAKQILVNLGCEPYKELRDICLKSFDKELRDNLAVYLAGRDLFTPDELEAWDMLKLMEEILHSKCIPNISFPVRAVPSRQRHIQPYDMPEISENSDKLSISTITQQSRDWRVTVLVELYFNTLDDRLKTFIEPNIAWKYLLSNNREDILITWINTYYSRFEGCIDIITRISDRSCTKKQPNAEDTEEMQIQKLFSEWDVTQSMIDSIHVVCSMTRTKEVVLDHLSRFGVFSSSERANPCTILTRFCRTKSLNDIEQILNQPLSSVSYCNFEDLYISFCIKHKLFNVIFPCFQNSDFSSDRIDSLCSLSLSKQEEKDLLKLWLTMKQLDGNLSDESIVHQAVLSATHFLSKGNTESYLQEHPLVTLATIVYGNNMIKDVVEKKISADLPIDSDSVHSVLRHFPVLKVALLSQQSDYNTRPDVTVYQLLQGCSPFDISKLFGWQSTHIIKDEEFPHFSSEKLSAKYGHNVTLSYMYYLKQGRPSIAVNVFIVDQLRLHRKISRKMKKQACNFAHGLALKRFANQSITCSCISFIEMLGVDSGNVRIHVAAANKILNYLNSSVSHSTGKEQLHEEQVGMLMHGLVVSKEQIATEILLLLETALLHSHSSDDSTVKQFLHWDLAVKFAKLHQAKLPEQFLRHCARADLWLPFVLFIQIHQYPVDQVLLLVKEFHSSHLQEHLSHALSHKMAVKQEHVGTKDRSKLMARDSRKVLYSTIGFQKGEAGSESLSESPTQGTESAMHVSSSSSEDSYQSSLHAVTISELTSYEDSNDVFCTLLSCHRSQDPPRALLTACHTLRNPLFAIFATCYEPSSVLACFCTWLITSLGSCISANLKSKLCSALQQNVWSVQQVESLLKEIVSTGYITTLARGFSIFLPENPLCAFTEFLMECVAKKNFKGSTESMKAFKAGWCNMKINPSIMACEDLEATFVNSGHWVASIAVSMACIALGKCFSSSHHQLLFINTLCKTSFTENLPVSACDFKLLAQLAECLEGTGVLADWAALCHDKGCTEYQAELKHCVDQLVENGRYQQGLDFVSLVGLPKDSVMIAQWSHEFKNVHVLKNQSESECTAFWYRCHEAFCGNGVSPKHAADFFKEHSKKVSSNKERYHVLKMALTWLKRIQECEDSDNDDSSVTNFEEDYVEMEMWKCLLQVDTELEEMVLQNLTTSNTTSKLLCSLKKDLQKVSRIPRETLAEEQEIARLDMLIGRLLDQADISTASRMEALFNHRNQDLQLLWTCMSLAEGEITPYQMSAEHRMLLSEPASTSSSTYKRRTLKSVRLTSVSSSGINSPGSSHSLLNQSISSDYVDDNVRDKQDTLSVLEKLVEHLQHGRKLGNRLVCCFRVAMNLDMPYQEILKLEDPLRLLHTSLANDCCNKFVVASDLMLAAQMNSEEVSRFLCQEIVAAVSNHVQGESNVFSGVTLWDCDLDLNCHLVLELCDDLSGLGTNLLCEATQIGASQLEANKEVVEILIRAHDCYTTALNMEGIVAVLHRAHILTTNLLQRQDWALMVRLLTGIGRYTEMNYIFQMLKDNEQFEFLLGKGLDKVPNLKLAVLDFLKQHCPEDRELFRLVSLHFSLFSEVADLWESEGCARVHTLLAVMGQQTATAPVLLTNTEDTKLCLNTAMVNFMHASEYFLQTNKLTRAMTAAHHAELVALQLSLINSLPLGQGADCLLELDSAQVAYMVTHKLSFPQACIMTRAYSHPVDWGATLYQHCIVQGDAAYLTDFMFNMPLTSALVEDVARRFQLEANATQEMAQQMKKFVLGISDVEIKYRVASQLGFRDVIESLLTGPALPYLKDTVWRSGFNKHRNYLQ